MSVGAVNKQTGERIPTAGMPAVDSVLSGTSTNPVQNRVVKESLDRKADTDIVASDFDTTASYTAGDYCIYEGKFYKFKANHSGAWAAADVDEIKIAGELSALKSGLVNLAPIKVTGHTPVTQGMATWNDSGIDFTNRHVIAFYIITAGDSTPYYVGQGIEGMSCSMNPTTNKPQIYVLETADAIWKDADCFAILL